VVYGVQGGDPVALCYTWEGGAVRDLSHPGYVRMLLASNAVRGASVPQSDYAARVAYALSSRWGSRP